MAAKGEWQTAVFGSAAYRNNGGAGWRHREIEKRKMKWRKYQRKAAERGVLKYGETGGDNNGIGGENI